LSYPSRLFVRKIAEKRFIGKFISRIACLILISQILCSQLRNYHLGVLYVDQKYQIDNLDRAILTALTIDARRPYIEIAEKLGVAGGTIHLRIDKLKQAGILRGFTTDLNYKALGYDVNCLIGIKLHDGKDYQTVVKKLKKFEEVLEIYFTTGSYNAFLNVLSTSNSELYAFLVEKIQKIPEIESTETVMVLDVPLKRSVALDTE